MQRETGVRVTADNPTAIVCGTNIFLGVKPAVVFAGDQGKRGALRGKLVISLAAGIRLASMEAFADARFLRVMTNTPSAMARAATALAPGARTTEADVAQVTEIFGAIGVVVR